ncbi:MAG: cell division protein FtsL [bacterium]
MANRKKRTSRRVYFLYVTVIFCAFFFYVWQHIQVIKVGYRINKLQAQLEELKNKNRYLRVQANQLKSLDRIEKIAIEELKMVKPNRNDKVIMPGDNR